MDIVPGCSANCLFTARECVRHDIALGPCEDLVADGMTTILLVFWINPTVCASCMPVSSVNLQGVVFVSMSSGSLQELVCKLCTTLS